MAPIAYGSVREVWFAKLADPSTRWSFLIRDDAYSRSGAIFGRTLRLGDPVDLGPNSTWVQETWEGGRDQEEWRDRAMFVSGNADATTEPGKLRLWPGLTKLHGTTNRGITRYTLCPGATGIGADTPLYIGEGNLAGRVDPTTATQVPPGGYQVVRYNPSTGTITSLKTDFPGSVNAICRMADGDAVGVTYPRLVVGLGSGQIYSHDITANTWSLEVTGKGVEVDSMVQFNDGVYYGAGSSLWKRTKDPASGSATFTEVKRIWHALTVRGLAVWNNRLWFCAVSTGSVTEAYVSDGVTVTNAFTFPSAFEVRAVCVHYGALYFAGDTSSGASAGSYVGQIWRYTGSSLTKVYEEGTGDDAEQHVFWDMASWGKYLVWGRPGANSTGRYPGFMLYDAEADAILEGPSFDMDDDSLLVAPGSVHVWNNTLVGSWYDHENYGAVNGPVLCAAVKLGGRVRHSFGGYSSVAFDAQPTTVERYALSSRYDGGIPGESKVWLTCRARVKVPNAANEIVVKAILDESGTEQTLSTITYNGNTGWRTVSFPIKVSGAYLKATVIQYKVYLRNSNSADDLNSTYNPEVDSIEVDFMPSPRKRRAWRMRVVASEAQQRLDGSNNSLTTTTAMIDKLEELWSEQQPVLFWDAGTVGGAPGGSGTEVMLSDYVTQPYRLETGSNDLGAEVAFGLTEVTQ